jgi:cell division protein ZapE
VGKPCPWSVEAGGPVELTAVDEAPGATGPVSADLEALVADGALSRDAMQAEAARLLDGVMQGLGEPRGFFSGLLGKPAPLKGAYLYGEVGRGKTMLMDLAFAAAPLAEKRRVHYHEFMDEMHAALAAFSDITKAMLLGRLFERLFAGGLVLIATSNVAPGDLYRDGLNRQLFLPFIDLLKAHASVMSLDGPTDYRRLKFEGQQVYYFGTGPEAKAAMDRLWARLTGGVAGHAEALAVLGRSIRVPAAAMGVARFSAAELVEQPLGPRDYLRLAHAYDAVIIDDVPVFDRTQPSAAKRFILLIDTLYDAGVKLGASFAAPIDQLGADEKTALEFQRAASRLVEMQSADYLAAPRKVAGGVRGEV